jgi:hypothetical protein
MLGWQRTPNSRVVRLASDARHASVAGRLTPMFPCDTVNSASGGNGLLARMRLQTGYPAMGMFNSIYADLRCSVKSEVAKDTEIQIKWQTPAARGMAAYRAGDTLDDLQAEFDNTWIMTDYICPVCSKYTIGKGGISYIKVLDQQRHPVFVHVEHGKICQVLAEDEFKKLGIADFVHDL